MSEESEFQRLSEQLSRQGIKDSHRWALNVIRNKAAHVKHGQMELEIINTTDLPVVKTNEEVAALRERHTKELEAALAELEAAGKTMRQRLGLDPQPKARPLVEVAPGFGMRDFLGRFCQKGFREFELAECHGNALVDYQEHLAAGKLAEAKYIRRMIPVWMLSCIFRGSLAWLLGLVIKNSANAKSGD
jgi:hypothetical protein